jgi:hypothetical protein
MNKALLPSLSLSNHAKRFLVICGFTGSIGILGALASLSNQKAESMVTQPKSAEAIYEEVRSICEQRGGWTYDINQCEEKETMARSKPKPKPIPEARWNAQEQVWLCPSSAYDTTSYRCTKETLLTKQEFDLNTKVEACTGRSGKEEESAGWYWAQRECRRNTNSF